MKKSQGAVIFLIVMLIINLIGALVYLIFNFKKENKYRKIINFSFFIVFPIVGEMFMLLALLLEYIIEHLKEQGLNINEVSFSKKRIKLLSGVDIDKELNSVPIEEALIISQKNDKRNAFIDILKGNNYKSMMGNIKQAVENDDSEVAHYAATFVSDTVAKFKQNEAKLRKKFNEDNSIDSVRDYVIFMQENLNAKVFGSVELRIYIRLFEDAASILYELSPDDLKDSTITMLVELLGLINNEEKIEVWIARARGRYRDSLECFKLCARYYYSLGDRDKLADLLRDIRMFSIPLDSESLEWVRLLRL